MKVDYSPPYYIMFLKYYYTNNERGQRRTPPVRKAAASPRYGYDKQITQMMMMIQVKLSMTDPQAADPELLLNLQKINKLITLTLIRSSLKINPLPPIPQKMNYVPKLTSMNWRSVLRYYT